MKLASLKEGGRDGTLIVVDRELKRAVRATGIAPTLQKAMDDWAAVSPRLAALAEELRDDKAVGSFELDTNAPPLLLQDCADEAGLLFGGGFQR